MLKIPVYREIRQLVISPQQDYIAILTSHTVHVALLPDPSLLNAEDTGALKLKTWQVGPTAHVVERSPVASAIWHPLVEGPCLVTVTEDAIVRLWELDRDNRWSFDNPSLPLDLRKLVNGSSVTQDFSPSKYGRSNGFSPDQFDMEVVAACFGGTGMSNEAGWASSTLWIAMRNGDVYALCPFLPSAWLMRPEQVFDLATLIESNDINNSAGASESSAQASKQQASWIADVLEQQRQYDADGIDGDYHSYKRPSSPVPIPELQGPYHFEPDADQVFDVTDIFAIAPKLLVDGNALDSSSDRDDSNGAPVTTICLATSDGLVHICLDIEDTQARWISDRSTASKDLVDDSPLPELLLIESIRVCEEQQQATWPLFSRSTNSRFDAYVTHHRGVSHISPLSSLDKLTDEVDATADQSTEFRLRLLAQSGETEIQPIVNLPTALPVSENSQSACIHVRDSDLDDFVLAAANGQPHTVTLDFSDLELLFEGDDREDQSDDELNPMYSAENRPSFIVPPELYAGTTLPLFAEDQKQKSGPSRQAMEREIRLAPATVTTMMEAHRLLGSETGKLQDAVSSLFQRCERMQDELKAQLERVGGISGRIDAIIDGNADIPQNEGDAADATSIEKRLENVLHQHGTLQDRYSQLKKRAAQLDRRPPSDKEKAWIQEIAGLRHLIVSADDEAANDEQGQARERFEEVKNVTEDLIQRSDRIGNTSHAQESEASPRKQRHRMDQVNTMLERETALVDATATKLEQLKDMV